MVQKAFDISKFRKDITKSITGISTGFHDPKIWLSSGCYALNYLISGHFHRCVPLGKVTVFAGEPAAGKSYIISGNIIRDAQQQGIYVVLIDTENALDEKWLNALGVDTSEDKLLKINVTFVDDVAKIISDFVKEYKKQPLEERAKVLFVVDSLGMLITQTDAAQFEKGELKGDMGRLPKALKALVKNCVSMFGDLDIGMAATNHVYASQDMYNPDPKVTGGDGFIYASSIVAILGKKKLKEDTDQGRKVTGIISRVKVMKTRYNKPYEEVEIEIPYDRGMDPYSGMFDLLERKGVLTRTGNQYIYKHGDFEIKKFKDYYVSNQDKILDRIMNEWDYESDYNQLKNTGSLDPEISIAGEELLQE